MIASRLEQASREAVDAGYGDPAAVAKAREGWSEHKKLFGKTAGSLPGKINTNPDAQEAADITGKLGRSPSDTADMMQALDLADAPNVKASLKARMMREAVANKGDLETQDLTQIKKRLRDADAVLKELADDPTSAAALSKLHDIAGVASKAGVLRPSYTNPDNPHGHVSTLMAIPANSAAIVSDWIGRLPLKTRVGIMRGLASGEYGRYIAQAVRGGQIVGRVNERARRTAQGE